LTTALKRQSDMPVTKMHRADSELSQLRRKNRSVRQMNANGRRMTGYYEEKLSSLLYAILRSKGHIHYYLCVSSVMTEHRSPALSLNHRDCGRRRRLQCTLMSVSAFHNLPVLTTCCWAANYLALRVPAR